MSGGRGVWTPRPSERTAKDYLKLSGLTFDSREEYIYIYMSWRAVKRGGTIATPAVGASLSLSSSSVSSAGVDGGAGCCRPEASGTTSASAARGCRAPAIDAREIDAPHVEALVASKRGRWLALERGALDGWARAVGEVEREEERYEDARDATVAPVAYVEDNDIVDARREGMDDDAASSSSSGDGDTVIAVDASRGVTMRSATATASSSASFCDDGSLMQLFDPGVRETKPLPGSLAMPKTPSSATPSRDSGRLPAVSVSAAVREASTMRFTLELVNVQFEVGALETVEGCMALYDLQSRVKLSENFYFSWPNAKQSAIAAFTIPGDAMSSNIRLVVHLTHLAADEGGIEDKVYTYKDVRKAKVHAEKERQRVLGMEALRQHEDAKNQRAHASRPSTSSMHSSADEQRSDEIVHPNVGKRRVALAWAVLPIFDSRAGASPDLSSLLSEIKCEEMYRVKEAYTEHSLIDAAMSFGASGHTLKSHKPIRCKMLCVLNPLSIPAPNTAEANGFTFPDGLVHVRDLTSFCPRTSNGELDWESAWGGAVDDGLARDLYVYVNVVDIGKRQDLRVRLRLRDDDLDIDGQGLLAFPSPCGHGMCRESWTTLSRLRSKGGAFYHEARVKLPVRLNPSHHLVLSIFGAQSASTGLFGSGPGEEELLGHSVINLCTHAETLAGNIASAMTPTGSDISLVAVRELLPKYLQSNVRTHMPYWEERKECVHVRLRLASTMHTGDVHIGALFAASAAWCAAQTPESEDKLRIAVSELSLASERALLQHLPAILNLLFSLTLRVSETENDADQRDEQSSRLSRMSIDDDAVSLASAGLSDDFGGSVDLSNVNALNVNINRPSSMMSIMSKNERVDETHDIATLAFHTIVRVVAAIQRVDPGPKPESHGAMSHSPPLEAYVTLAFGALEKSSSTHLNTLQTIATSSHAAVPVHTILATRYSAVLARSTRESYVPYEEALSMSWFFLGVIFRALALERAQSPSDSVSMEFDEAPLRHVVDTLSNEVKTRGERSTPSFAELEQARNLNCGLAAFLAMMFTIPGMKKAVTGISAPSAAASNKSKSSAGRAGPLAPLATTLAAMHIASLGEGNSVHTALFREFLDTLCASPVYLDIITASAVNEGKNGWTNLETTKFGPGDVLVSAITESIRLNLITVSGAHADSSNARAACAARIVAASLARHAWDVAWQSIGARRSVAAAYAPLLRMLVSQYNTIASLPLSARRDALVSILTLSRDSDSNKLWTWLSEDAIRMKCFVSALSMAARDFAYERDETNAWSPSGPQSSAKMSSAEAGHDKRVDAGHLNTCVYTIIIRLIREWHTRVKSNWGVMRYAARAIGMRQQDDPNATVVIASPRTSPKSSQGTLSFEDAAESDGNADDDGDEIKEVSFNALEGVLGVMLTILSRPQSASAWEASAPILNALLREHRKVLMASLHARDKNAPIEAFPPAIAAAPGITPYAFLQGAATAVFKAAARPSPVCELAVASLRTMLEAAVDIFGTSEKLCPTLIYALHAASFPLTSTACGESLSRSLRALKLGTEVSPSGWNNSVKDTLAALEDAERCIRALANAVMHPSSKTDTPRAVELECALASALKASPAAQVKVLRSLSNRLANEENWVEAAEASTAAAIVTMQAFSVAAPHQCVWVTHDVEDLRDSFFALTTKVAPLPSVAGIRCGTEEIGEAQILAHLSRAVEFFTKGGHLEAALRVIDAAQIAWESHREFGALSESHAMMSELFRRLHATSNVGDAKQYKWDMEGKPPPDPATFWRIRLIGDAWGEKNGAEWIYRESLDRTLGDMNRKLVKEFSNYVPSGTLIKALLTNVEPVIDEGCAGLQIMAVQRDVHSFEQSDVGGGVGGTGFSQCRVFTFDTPVLFTESGEVSQQHGPIVAPLRYQGRRRTTITVNGAFPGLVPRLSIADTKVEEMNPCQSAIQMLDEQTTTLLAAANARAPQAELLQRLLQGSLAAGVNGGVPSLIQSFFSVEVPATVTAAGAPFLTPARAVERAPETPSSRASTPAIMHRRVLSENVVPIGAGIPLDTPPSASYPSPSPNFRAPPPSPASVASLPTPLAPTPMSATTLSPSTPAPPLSRSDRLGLLKALWKLHKTCKVVVDVHSTLDQPAHLQQLFDGAIEDLRASIQSVEGEISGEAD